MGDPRWVVFAFVVVGLAGCEEGAHAGPGGGGGGSGSSAPPGATPATTPTPTPAATPATAPAATPAPALPELVTESFYRAPGGRAVLRYPASALLAKWKHRFRKDGDLAVITFLHEDGARRAQIELRFPPGQPKPLPPKALAEGAAAALAKQVPGARVLGGRELPLAGGGAWGVALEAALNGEKITLGVVAVADGGDAVLVTTMAHAALYDAPAVKPVLEAIFGGLQVGSKVPRAPALSPGKPLQGTYLRLGRRLGEFYLLHLDPRGWALEDGDVGALDVDAAYVARGGALARYVVKGGEVHITDHRGRSRVAQQVGPDLQFSASETYCRTGRTDGLVLDGKWTSSTFVDTTNVVGDVFTASASSRYRFGADGSFSDSSSVSANLSQPVTPGGAAVPAVTSGTSGAGGVGRYEIRGDRLWLTRDGTTWSVPFYGRGCKGAKMSTRALVIGGNLYLQDD